MVFKFGNRWINPRTIQRIESKQIKNPAPDLPPGTHTILVKLYDGSWHGAGTTESLDDFAGRVNAACEVAPASRRAPAQASPDSAPASEDAVAQGASDAPGGPSREWLEKAAEVEDACRSVSVGGLAADVGLLPPYLTPGNAAAAFNEARLHGHDDWQVELDEHRDRPYFIVRSDRRDWFDLHDGLAVAQRLIRDGKSARAEI